MLVQVETEEAMKNIEAICAVDGVDGVFIGPADLHASMGYIGETSNPGRSAAHCSTMRSTPSWSAPSWSAPSWSGRCWFTRAGMTNTLDNR